MLKIQYSGSKVSQLWQLSCPQPELTDELLEANQVELEQEENKHNEEPKFAKKKQDYYFEQKLKDGFKNQKENKILHIIDNRVSGCICQIYSISLQFHLESFNTKHWA